MDNNSKICGLIGLMCKAGKITAGTDACLEEIKKGKAKLIIIAKDCSDRTKNIFYEEAKKYQIKIYEILSIEQISKSIGKVNKAVIVIKDLGISKKIASIIDGGEVIG